MPDAAYWVEWTMPGSVNWLREFARPFAEEHGFDWTEQRLTLTSSDWGTFQIVQRGASEQAPIGVARAQLASAARVQLIIAPLAGRTDAESLRSLNHFAVLLYTELVRDGRLAPPPPLELLSIRLTNRAGAT